MPPAQGQYCLEPTARPRQGEPQEAPVTSSRDAYEPPTAGAPGAAGRPLSAPHHSQSQRHATLLGKDGSTERILLTAALELSTNQVTHFYSEKKNTAEMIRLMEVLLAQYAGCDKIYLSWDAASWHASKKLYERVEEVNSAEYRARHRTP